VNSYRVNEHRLAAYGTLAPGRVNEDQLSGLEGKWTEGAVRGHLTKAGWGAHLGFPGLIPDPQGDFVPVFVFHSPELPAHWARLDAFEGEAYQRITIEVTGDGEPYEAWIYALSERA